MPIDEASKYCHFIINNDAMVEPPQSTELVTRFQRGTLEDKKKALQTLIKLISNDENYPRLLMPVLTNLQMIGDHSIKKLLFLYWEVVEKTNVDGTVKDEIMLAVNALRKDLDSPNEFIRGRTLRLVSKISVQQIVEDLIDAVITNLEHRNCYVRRNAIMCIYSVYQSFGLDVVENCIEDIEKIMISESDLSTKRNAFLLLFNLDQERALAYLQTILQSEDPVAEMGDIFQLIVLEMLRKLCKVDPQQKTRLMKAIFMMSNSKSTSVLFECANTITQLTTAPSAIKVAIQSYLNLLQEHNDNNVKIIVLDKILDLRKKYAKVLEDYITDILAIIRSETVASLEINQKVLELTTQLVSPRNIKEVILFMEREIARACKMEEHGSQAAITNEYRYLLIKSINQITQSYPETIPAVLSPLMDQFLKFEGKSTFTSLETILFIREVIEVHPEHRSAIFSKICKSFSDIRSHLVIRVALWIIGEYAQTQDEVTSAFASVKRNIGSLPIYPQKLSDEEQEEQEKVSAQEEIKDKGPEVVTKTVILADGSYGTQTIVMDDAGKKSALQNQNECSYLPLRNALINTEDDYLSSCLAITLTKLVIKSKKNLSKSFQQSSLDSILILCALLKERQSPDLQTAAASGKKHKRVDRDSMQRMQLCLKILTQPQSLKSLSVVQKVLIEQGRAIFAKFLESHSKLLPSNALKEMKKQQEESLLVTQPDEKVVYRQLKSAKSKGVNGAAEFDITEELSGANSYDNQDFMSSVKSDIDQKIYQLTGYSDPIYAEAIAEVHHYDILLKIVLINRTQKTIQNINCELLTQGNLKVVEKPVALTLQAGATQIIKASLKVSSTDNGAIYGYLTFDSASGNIPHVININEIQIDFINALMPAECSELEFKKRWAEYEWENKVQVSTPITDLKEYVEHFANSMNIKLMTQITQQDQQAGFLVANFYTKSKFQEDCLINMSIEKTAELSSAAGEPPTVRISGLIRLRAKTEGMALCVGEKCKQQK